MPTGSHLLWQYRNSIIGNAGRGYASAATGNPEQRRHWHTAVALAGGTRRATGSGNSQPGGDAAGTGVRNNGATGSVNISDHWPGHHLRVRLKNAP
jgi:hypothetical protein